jgi:L-aminopeptidase/D-esterase-like protein
MQNNDNTKLVPQTNLKSPELTFDFPAIKIGVAEYDEGPTGCTVFYFPVGVTSAIDVRGGDAGFLGDYGWLDAICLAGGSLYGLEAVSGVNIELSAMRHYSTRWSEMPLVSGAVIFDYEVRDTAIYPDKALGRAAMQAVKSGRFPLGARGAGRSASVGKLSRLYKSEMSGQGGAFQQIGKAKIAVFTVVNAVGVIVDRQGNIIRGNLDPRTGQRHHYFEAVEKATGSSPAGGNTTLTVVVTNQKLDNRRLKQIGRQIHDSMSRAIQPFHTLTDGDVLFMLSTNEIEENSLNVEALAIIASELAWDAVLSIYHRTQPFG